MPPRILDVTASTTFDMLDARTDTHEFTESGYAVLDVSIPRDSPDHVQLTIELDATDLDALTPQPIASNCQRNRRTRSRPS